MCLLARKKVGIDDDGKVGFPLNIENWVRCMQSERKEVSLRGQLNFDNAHRSPFNIERTHQAS